jgi:hypothetical protein
MSRPRHLWRWVIGLGALAGIAIGVFISINLLRGKTDGWPKPRIARPVTRLPAVRHLRAASPCRAGSARFTRPTLRPTLIMESAAGAPTISGARCMTGCGATGSSFTRRCPTLRIAA